MLAGTPTFGVCKCFLRLRASRAHGSGAWNATRASKVLAGTPTFGVQVSPSFAREPRSRIRRMERHTRINSAGGNAYFRGASVSFDCARVTLTDQAHGTPLAHKQCWRERLLSGCKCLLRLRASRAHGSGAWNATRASKVLAETPTFGVQVSPSFAREPRSRIRRMERQTRINSAGGNAHFRGASVSNLLRASRAYGSGAWNAIILQETVFCNKYCK